MADSEIAIRFGILLLIVLLMVFLHMYNTNINKQRTEMFLSGAPVDMIDNSVMKQQANAQPADLSSASEPHPYVNQDTTYPRECFPKDSVSPSDLLPGQNAANSPFAQLQPLGQGHVENINFLNSGYHLGINTQGQSLRNANLQLRSEVPNPRTVVSPWMQSTIEPDRNRRPLEIGADGGC